MYFDNKKEITIAYRCELDALNIKELNDVDYKSQNEYMHACGHDGHIAILLKLGEYINYKIRELKNNYMLIFEHAEETYGGSKDIILDDFYIEHLPKYVFGLHLYPGLKQGDIFLKEGYFLAKPIEVDVEITGKTSHVIYKENGIDSMSLGIKFLTKVEQRLNNVTNIRFLFGTFRSGNQRNVVSDKTLIQGTYRTFSDNMANEIKKIILQIKKEIDLNNLIHIKFNDTFKAVYNNIELVNKIKTLYQVKETEHKFISDSFAFYQEKLQYTGFCKGINDTLFFFGNGI